MFTADTGAATGAAAAPTQPKPPAEDSEEKEKTASEPPKPEGETIEARLNSAIDHIKNLFERGGQLASQLASANSEKSRIEGQFNAVSGDFEKEKTEHVKTKGELGTAKTTIAGLTTQRDDANKNVERLEKLCNLRGIDPSSAAHVPPTDAADSDSKRQELVAKLNKETDPLRRGQLANELREFDAKRKGKA